MKILNFLLYGSTLWIGLNSLKAGDKMRRQFTVKKRSNIFREFPILILFSYYYYYYYYNQHYYRYFHHYSISLQLTSLVISLTQGC